MLLHENRHKKLPIVKIAGDLSIVRLWTMRYLPEAVATVGSGHFYFYAFVSCVYRVRLFLFPYQILVSMPILRLSKIQADADLYGIFDIFMFLLRYFASN